MEGFNYCMNCGYKLDPSDNFCPNCGVKLEFKSSGEWREVDCEPDAVPVLIIPEKILQFVNNKYPDSYVVSIERKLTRYLVDLNNDLELVFDDEGNFKRIDD